MSKQNYNKYFILLLLFITSELISAQESWKLERDKDGIKIYSGIVEGSDFKSFKAQMLLKGSIHSFVALLQDIENMTEWGYNLKSAELLKKSGDTIQIYYAEATAPFPFENRDGIYLNKFRWERNENHLFVKIELLPDYLGKKEKIVRVKGKGYWSVRVLNNEMLDIIFSMEVDPGGNIPGWLANIMVDTTPFSTMTELRRVMSDKKYQDRNFGFIDQ
jgi:hypothetical protein